MSTVVLESSSILRIDLPGPQSKSGRKYRHVVPRSSRLDSLVFSLQRTIDGYSRSPRGKDCPVEKTGDGYFNTCRNVYVQRARILEPVPQSTVRHELVSILESPDTLEMIKRRTSKGVR